jgi:hypothetical protein
MSTEVEKIIEDWKNKEVDYQHTIIPKRTIFSPPRSAENCKDKHDFQFYEFMGTYCSECGIPFGSECLNPGCKQIDCDKHMLVYEAFSELSYGDVANTVLVTDTQYIHLAHDGVGCNSKKDPEGLRRLLNNSQIKRIEFCDYYSPKYFYEIINEYKDILFVPI